MRLAGRLKVGNMHPYGEWGRQGSSEVMAVIMNSQSTFQEHKEPGGRQGIGTQGAWR